MMGKIILTDEQIEHCAEFQQKFGLELTPFNGCSLSGHELTVVGKIDAELSAALATFDAAAAKTARLEKVADKQTRKGRLIASLAKDGLTIDDLREFIREG